MQNYETIFSISLHFETGYKLKQHLAKAYKMTKIAVHNILHRNKTLFILRLNFTFKHPSAFQQSHKTFGFDL